MIPPFHPLLVTPITETWVVHQSWRASTWEVSPERPRSEESTRRKVIYVAVSVRWTYARCQQKKAHPRSPDNFRCISVMPSTCRSCICPTRQPTPYALDMFPHNRRSRYRPHNRNAPRNSGTPPSLTPNLITAYAISNYESDTFLKGMLNIRKVFLKVKCFFRFPADFR